MLSRMQRGRRPRYHPSPCIIPPFGIKISNETKPSLPPPLLLSLQMSCGTSQERGQEERNRQREESPLPFSSACNVSGLPSHSPSTEKLGTRSSLGGGFVSGSWMKSLLVEGRLWGGWPSAPSATPRHFPWPRGVWKHETITQQSRGLSTCPPWTWRSRGVASIEETFFFLLLWRAFNTGFPWGRRGGWSERWWGVDWRVIGGRDR